MRLAPWFRGVCWCGRWGAAVFVYDAAGCVPPRVVGGAGGKEACIAAPAKWPWCSASVRSAGSQMLLGRVASGKRASRARFCSGIKNDGGAGGACSCPQCTGSFSSLCLDFCRLFWPITFPLSMLGPAIISTQPLPTPWSLKTQSWPINCPVPSAPFSASSALDCCTSALWSPEQGQRYSRTFRTMWQERSGLG